MRKRRCQAAPGGRIVHAGELRRGALRHQVAAARAGAGAQVDHMIGAADRFLVMLDDDEGIALAAQPVERIEERQVVARVQAYGGLVQYVAHPLQVRAELGGKADSLRLAAGERGGGTIELQDSRGRHRTETRCAPELRAQIACDVEFAAEQFELVAMRRRIPAPAGA